MTRESGGVPASLPYKSVLVAVHEAGGRAVPVVDEEGRAVGIVSESDLLARAALRDADISHTDVRRLQHWAQRDGLDTAGGLMTSAPRTVTAGTSTATAAGLLDRFDIAQLVVVDDDGRPIGTVSRADLLRTYLRPDTAIRSEIVEDVLDREFSLETGTVDVDVANGVVTLGGQLESDDMRPALLRAVGLVPGVVGVVDHTTALHDRPHRSVVRSGPYV